MFRVEGMKGITISREREIRKAVREQLAFHLEEDLTSREYLFKEVYEQCDTAAGVRIAENEIKFLRKVIKGNKL